MEASPSRKFAPPRWGAERRLELIDFRLLWDGTVNRSELVDFFGISTQQASSDLARYAEQAPNNMFYDKSAKTYRAATNFKPLLARSDAEQFLSQLGESTTGTIAPAGLLIGWRPSCDVVRYPARAVSNSALSRVLRAIREGADIRVQYQSMRRPAPTARWIAPHALASDGLRWHVRAWCHESSEFRDFVLSRMQRVTSERAGSVNPAGDENWHTYVDLIIRPRPELSEGQRSAIELDYGMKRGRLVVRCRKALAFYAMRQLQLDRPPSTPAPEQPLELENRTELNHLIVAGRKLPDPGAIQPASKEF